METPGGGVGEAPPAYLRAARGALGYPLPMNPDDLTPDERQLLVRLADCELEPRQVEEAFSASPAGERAQRRAPARESLHRLVDLGVLACMVVHYDRAGPTA